jgi:DNA-directed RNA polymerase specialized sigma24 family protein
LRLVQTQSDERLALLACHGHDFAFGELVRRHRPALERHARRLAGDPSLAEQALERGLLRAWAELLGGRAPVEVRPWLIGLVHSHAAGSPARLPRTAERPLAEAGERCVAAARGAATALVPARALVRLGGAPSA